MRKTLQYSAALAALVALSGCGLPGTFRAQSFIEDESLSGGNFSAELAKAYQQRAADAAVNDVNWVLAGAYAGKGRDAAAGNAPELWDPQTYVEQPSFDYGVDADRAATYALAERRARAVSVIAANKDRQPKACALTQATYDWLVDESYQNTPPTPPAEIKKIGVKFEQYLAQCAGSQVVASAPAPRTAPQVDTKYVVYFAWDKYSLTPEAKAVIRSAATAASTAKAAVSVSAYTDTSGSSKYNDRLSVKRASVTATEAKANGAAVRAVQGFGERSLAKPTADGVREPLNRRAVLDIGSGQ